MKIIAATHSNLPRVGDAPEEQKLRRAYAKLEKKQLTQSEFDQVQAGLIEELIDIQETAGCGIVTDGMIGWYDHLSHLASRLSGFEINGLLRFFDTNYYYRQPIAGADIAEGAGGLAEDVAFTRKKASGPVKAVLFGPYSLARMSQNRSSLDFEGLCLRLADILAIEAGRMAASGAAYIQIEEPAFIRDPKNPELFKKAVSRIFGKKGKAKLIIAFYFGDCTPALDMLGEIETDFLGLDFSYSPGLRERLKSGGCVKPLSLGLLDGRNTKMEDPDRLAGDLDGLIDNLSGDECHITTSSGLEFLPRNYAVRKLELTSRVADLLNGSSK